MSKFDDSIAAHRQAAINLADALLRHDQLKRGVALYEPLAKPQPTLSHLPYTMTVAIIVAAELGLAMRSSVPGIKSAMGAIGGLYQGLTAHPTNLVFIF